MKKEANNSSTLLCKKRKVKKIKLKIDKQKIRKNTAKMKCHPFLLVLARKVLPSSHLAKCFCYNTY
jgi:hypothetical protein